MKYILLLSLLWVLIHDSLSQDSSIEYCDHDHAIELKPNILQKYQNSRDFNIYLDVSIEGKSICNEKLINILQSNTTCNQFTHDVLFPGINYFQYTIYDNLTNNIFDKETRAVYYDGGQCLQFLEMEQLMYQERNFFEYFEHKYAFTVSALIAGVGKFAMDRLKQSQFKFNDHLPQTASSSSSRPSQHQQYPFELHQVTLTQSHYNSQQQQRQLPLELHEVTLTQSHNNPQQQPQQDYHYARASYSGDSHQFQPQSSTMKSRLTWRFHSIMNRAKTVGNTLSRPQFQKVAHIAPVIASAFFFRGNQRMYRPILQSEINYSGRHQSKQQDDDNNYHHIPSTPPASSSPASFFDFSEDDIQFEEGIKVNIPNIKKLAEIIIALVRRH